MSHIRLPWAPTGCVDVSNLHWDLLNFLMFHIQKCLEHEQQCRFSFKLSSWNILLSRCPKGVVCLCQAVTFVLTNVSSIIAGIVQRWGTDSCILLPGGRTGAAAAAAGRCTRGECFSLYRFSWVCSQSGMDGVNGCLDFSKLLNNRPSTIRLPLFFCECIYCNLSEIVCMSYGEQAASQPTLSQQLQPQQSPQQQQMQAQNQANLFEQLAQAASSGAALQKVHSGLQRLFVVGVLIHRQASP